jgi:hypothetical protein
VSFYRRRDVEAVQWSGSNWHQMYAMTGHDSWVVEENMLRVTPLPGMAAVNAFKVKPGEWVVKRGPSQYEIYTDDAFQASFEEVPA